MEVPGAQSAYRVLDLLTQVSLHPEGVSASDAAATLGLTVPTAHRLLRVLVDRGFAVQDAPGGRFRPGPQIRLLAGDGIDHQLLAEVARPALVRLRDETNETVFLSVRDGLQLSYLDVLVSTHSVQMYGAVGMRVPLHATSQGKVILAFLPEGVTQRLVDQLEYERYTANTITEPAALMAEIDKVRQAGYAVNLEEREIGVRSVAAPVLGGAEGVVAAVCVGGPIYRVSEEALHERLGPLTRAAAQEITERLNTRAATGGTAHDDAGEGSR